METWGGPLALLFLALAMVPAWFAIKNDNPGWFAAFRTIISGTTIPVVWDGSFAWAVFMGVWAPGGVHFLFDWCRRNMHGHPSPWQSLCQRERSFEGGDK